MSETATVVEGLANQGRRDNDPTDLDMTFTADDERFGETHTVELKPGGTEISVTNENKGEYVQYVMKSIQKE